jgi:uncharacterized protein YggU (UPF0235/DUF167 family)
MYVRVHVTPGAKKEKVIKESDTLFYISVREPALQNMANTRIREILAHEFAVPLGQVQILTGHHSCGKMVSIDRK